MRSEAEVLAAEPSPSVQEWTPEDVPTGWRLETLDDADWALSRVAELQREAEENEGMARTAIARIEARKQLLGERIQKGLSFFKSHLEAYATTHRAELLNGGKKKSRALLHGSIGWRSASEQLKVVDPDALLEWCRQQPAESEVLRITEAVNKKGVNELFKSTGELPPGTEVEPAREEVVIKAEMAGVPNEH